MDIKPFLDEVEVFKSEIDKFERGKKSAGTRARKSLQTIKKIAHELRIQIQETKKTDTE